MKNIKLYYHLIITILFVYVFIQFLTLKTNNIIYKFYVDYVMNKYCLVIYISLLFYILKYDKYTTVLLFLLIIGPFRCASKEYFEDNTNPIQTNDIITDKLFGVDDRFKMDDIKKDEILKQIKAQINFDPYKTNLSKDVINEIYSKYFDNDIFIKLNTIDKDSKEYIASGNFNYVPKNNKVDYDITKYENLSQNSAFGINQIIDDKYKL